jgi:RNA polymerase sigma-70 factor (ECF subfamily)
LAPARLYVVGADQPRRTWDDEELLAGVVGGDQGAAVAFFDRFEPLVRRLLVRLLGPSRDTDDLAQEVFLRLFRHAETVLNARALTAFVIATTTRIAQSELRRAWVRRIVRLSPADELAEVPDAGPDPAARQAVRRFYGVLAQLRPTHRTAFVLRHFEEMELAEIAEALAVSLATTKRLLVKARTRVDRLIAHDPGLAEYLAILKGDRS